MGPSGENSTNVRPREVGFGALGSVVAALVMHWPLPLYLGRDVPRDLGDPLPQSWQVAWDGHALLHQPLDFFQANVFYPLKNSLAFSDALVGYAPFGAIGSGPHAAVARYGLLFLFAYALAFFGAYLLARELGAGRVGAWVAGAAFAYAPWRLEQDGHLHVLSSGGVPLALFLLVRGYRRRAAPAGSPDAGGSPVPAGSPDPGVSHVPGGSRPGLVFAGWLVAAWQVSLGFSIGLQLAYLLLVLGFGAVAFGGFRPDRRALVATAAGGAVFLLVALALARPYLDVGHDHPESKRTDATVAAFSGWPRMYITPPGANTVWSGATVEQRRRVKFVPEQTLFPGLTVVVLTVICLVKGVYSRRRRWCLLGGVLASVWLALGIHDGSFPWPYELVYHHLPGWNSSRTPSRLNTLTSLGLALLAAGGAAWLARRLRRPRVVGAVLVALVLLEGAGFSVSSDGLAGPAHPTVPTEPAGERGLRSPQLHLPISREGNRRYMLWSTAGFPRIVNGRASFQPALTTQIALDVAGFPDARSVARLRALGVRTVVLHPSLAAGTAWADAASKPIAGLGLTRERRGDVVVYSLR